MQRFEYRPPDFSAPGLRDAPDATFAPMPADRVVPDAAFFTTNLPTYVRVGGTWRRPRAARMDCVIVREPSGGLVVHEPRRLAAGTLVALGSAEDGSEGIYVHAEGFLPRSGARGEFHFMATEVSRERPVNYELLAALLCEERERGGRILWVVGPALVHSRARDNLVWFIEQGFVNVFFGGNAIAVHDLEVALHGTTLGMTAMGDPTAQGHALHMRTINTIQRVGSVAAAVEQGMVRDGIMYALVRRGIPFVLAGSIRDDGPLPEVITDTLAAQDAMRAHAMHVTFAVFLATALHAIAVGNMLPAYVDEGDERLRPLATICVDQTEFVVNKLRDRGTHQAYGVVTNAQDFLQVLRLYVERWEQRRRSA